VLRTFDVSERASAAGMKIDPGEQRVGVTLFVSFELE
jgi:hypothetical protein